MKKLSLIVAALLFSCRLEASVYKCVDENGKTRYQAAACIGVVVPIDETQPPIAPLAKPAPVARLSAGGHRAVRSEAKKNLFKSFAPCPSTGESNGPCPGYVVDHIKPLACGGADDPRNMQWQTVAAGKAKDRWERIGCQPAAVARPGLFPSVRSTPGGGKFKAIRSGRPHYLGAWADGD